MKVISKSSQGKGIEEKAKLAELMTEVKFLQNKLLAERLMIEKKMLTEAKRSQVYKDMQNKISGEEITPKKRVNVRTSVKVDQPRNNLNLFLVTRKKMMTQESQNVNRQALKPSL